MILKKYRWSQAYESAEEELIKFLDAKNISAERWTGAEYQVFPIHSHDYDKKLWCAEGSIIFTIDEKRISLQPGDALDLPASTVHEATSGISGCVCYEQSQNKP